jgi:chromo domain-containing protein 1
LAKTGYIEQDDASEPLSQVMDKFPILSERRIIAESEPVDYFRTVARSQEAANLNMIRYYAGLQVEMRRDYRHFFVVHTQPRAGYVQQWRQEIQTIGGVLSPKQCVEELQKDSKVSLFDFCERFMPKKEAEEKDRVHGGQRE